MDFSEYFKQETLEQVLNANRRATKSRTRSCLTWIFGLALLGGIGIDISMFTHGTREITLFALGFMLFGGFSFLVGAISWAVMGDFLVKLFPFTSKKKAIHRKLQEQFIAVIADKEFQVKFLLFMKEKIDLYWSDSYTKFSDSTDILRSQYQSLKRVFAHDNILEALDYFESACYMLQVCEEEYNNYEQDRSLNNTLHSAGKTPQEKEEKGHYRYREAL